METGILIAYMALGVMALLPIYFGARLSLYYPDTLKKVKNIKSILERG